MKRLNFKIMQEPKDENLYKNIVTIIEQGRSKIVRAVNETLTTTFFLIGKTIVEDQQNGSHRATYGKEILQDLSIKLTANLGKGFSVDNLENMRKFYLVYSQENISETPSRFLVSISETPSRKFELSWSHYLKLMRIVNLSERNFYEIECIENSWSVRELNRQFDSGLYERLALSKDKKAVLKLAQKGQIIEQPKDLIKDPYVLEFLNLPEHHQYNETDLEQGLINKLEHFLLELGKGFSFVGRQVRFTFDEEHFRVDLVFYNRFLRCFVLIDLKIGKLKHQDLGQMQMYVNYYDRFVKTDDENATIGIVLCKDKKDALVEITLPKDNTQIFASSYLTYIPSKEMLIKLIKS